MTSTAPHTATAPGSLEPSTTITRQRRQLRWAAALMLVQGVLMEGIVAVALPILVLLGVAQHDITARAHVFALPYLQENLYLMMAMSGVFAALRVLGAVGVLRDRAWGFALSLVMCVVTLVLMVFLLPAGIADGVLSGLALVLLVFARWGRRADGAPRTILGGAPTGVG